MQVRNWLMAAATVGLICGLGQAQERRLFGRPNCPPPCECPPATPGSPNPTTDPSAMPPQSNAFNEALASAGEGGTQPAASYMPGFFGDILGGFVTTRVFSFALDRFVTVQIPNSSQAGGYKISENESPRPIDRVFYNYNFYGNIQVSGVPDVPKLQLHRHVIGFEKTLLDGDASVGVRLPFLNTAGDLGYQSGSVGDMAIVFKYALYNDRASGNLFSLGLVVGTPTGDAPAFLDPNGIRSIVLPIATSTVLQPWFGYIYNVTQNLYVQGFHSTSIPTDASDVIFMGNDVAAGYWLYRNPDAILRGIIPTAEIHVNTPLNHRTIGPVTMSDQVTVTSGWYFLFSRAVVGGAVGIPILCPNKIEALASVNMRF
jgi:hypothetical protein